MKMSMFYSFPIYFLFKCGTSIKYTKQENGIYGLLFYYANVSVPPLPYLLKNKSEKIVASLKSLVSCLFFDEMKIAF